MKASYRFLCLLLALCMLGLLPACSSGELEELGTPETATATEEPTKEVKPTPQKKPFTSVSEGMELDVIIFGGQSNMQGQTGSFPIENDPVEGAWEYHVQSDYYVPVKHPIGENIGDRLLSAASGNNGSMVPAFCRTFVQETGHNVAAIHVARGNTAIDEWIGTERYTVTIDKIKKGLDKIREKGATIRSISYVWLQGESDAIGHMPQAEYEQKLIQLKNDLKRDIGLERFGIVQVGYFNRYRSSAEVGLTEAERAAFDEAIQRAQMNVTTYDSDFVMLSTLAPTLYGQNQYFNPEATGHFNNKGQDLLGSDAAKTLASILKD
ncbi:MAG: hypothetical protein IJC84_01380 [Clostridia bacterium]|nr:hypothetical protein [Clostridia bacterium]